MTDHPDQVWFQTDDAWVLMPPARLQHLRRYDVRDEACALRFVTSRKKIDAFTARHAPRFRPYTLFGSGDFHHLTAVWTRQFQKPFTILSFDNHPDWDIRPPRWSCGAWVNRALENPFVQRVAIFGCGNFECNRPHRLLANRRAAKAGRLLVHPWAQTGQTYPAWLTPITPESWRDTFTAWLKTVAGHNLYITVDLDCLQKGEIPTNWEPGRFVSNDIAWALQQTRSQTNVIGGDVCGAWSTAHYLTRFQKIAAWFDHPEIGIPALGYQAERQEAILTHLWPALTGTPLS
jgi:arginase family enzyme